MTFRNCVAVDLGASSGRVMLARYERECRSLTLREIHRFNNGLHSQNGYVTRDVDSLESAIRLGLNKVCEEGIRKTIKLLPESSPSKTVKITPQ